MKTLDWFIVVPALISGIMALVASKSGDRSVAFLGLGMVCLAGSVVANALDYWRPLGWTLTLGTVVSIACSSYFQMKKARQHHKIGK